MRQEGLLILALVLSLGFLVALGSVAIRDAEETVHTQSEIRRTHLTIEHAQNVVDHLREAEDALVRYLETRDDALLDPYRDGRTGIGKDLAALKNLTADQPEQQERLVAVEGLLRDRLRTMDGRIAAPRRPGDEGVVDEQARREAERARPGIREGMREFEEDARTRLLERSQEADASARSNLRASAVLSVGAAAFYFVLFGLLVHRMRGLRRATQAGLSLNADLTARQTALERANRELDAFTYSVSHDLRAPLRAVDGYSRILLDDHGDRLDAEGRRLVGVMRAEVKRMGQLLEGLLALSRVDRQELRTEDVDLGDVVRAALAGVRSAEGSRPVDVAVDPLPTVQGDPTLLHQVFYNLLANAFKFTRSREKAEIHVTAAREDGRHVVTIRDNGVGFPPERADRLFGVFRRLHDDDRYEGVGVGLAIVERIVRRHGGAVSAEGVDGKGATFRVSLPTAAPP